MSQVEVETSKKSSYKRQCTHWLQTWRDWVLPQSAAPESIILWTGYFTVAASLRRHVWVPRTLLHGGWDCYPHMYVMYVSPPGVVFKSTSIAFAEKLLEGVSGLTEAPSNTTNVALIQAMRDSVDSSAYLIADEFPELIQKSGYGMFETLTRLFDGKKKHSEGTMMRGQQFVENPCLNMIAGANPKWVSEIPEAYISGGFASRIVPIYEENARKYRMWQDEDVDPKHFEDLENRLKADLNHIGNSIQGEFKVDKDAKDYLEGWYQSQPLGPPGTDPKMRGYYVRRPAYVMKLAMIWHLSYSDELVLNLGDFKFATQSMRAIEPKILKTFQNIGKNKFTHTVHDILKFIRERGKVPKDIVFDTFHSEAEPAKLSELIQGLIIAKRIEIVNEGELSFYKFSERPVT